MISDEDWGRALFAAPRVARAGALERANRVARASVGRVDRAAVDKILDDERARAMLASAWVEYPPDRWLLADAVSRRAEGDDALWSLLQELHVPGDGQRTRRALAELDAWNRARGSLLWYTSAAPADLVELNVSGVDISEGRAVLALTGPLDVVRAKSGVQVALTAWRDDQPQPVDIVQLRGGIAEVAWVGVVAKTWTAVARRSGTKAGGGSARSAVADVRFEPAAAAAGTGAPRTSTPERSRAVVVSESGSFAHLQVTAGRLGSNVDVRLVGEAPPEGLWTVTGERVTADRDVRIISTDRVLADFLAEALEFGR